MRLRATILQTPEADTLEVLEDQVIDVEGDGTITSVAPAGMNNTDGAISLPPDTVLIPGLVDTHVHASQWPQLGTGLDLPLDEWLFAYTFPLEARYADTDFARRVWVDMVPRLLAHGTTTAVYYTSIHRPATLALAETCVGYGQRALVGRVAMDHPDGTPEWYRDDDAGSAIEASARSVEEIRQVVGNHGLVEPIITPRFIPACTDELLTGLGQLAADTGVRVQTHCSENQWEHDYVLERHGCTDTESLNRFGLLRPNTVLAHATHLTAEDRAKIASSRAGVSHCPLSNVYFSERVFAARAALDAGIPVGLGTDIAGGPEPSLLAQCGHAVGSSRLLEREAGVQATGRRIDIVAAFWMATVGGATMLDLPVGLLAEGRRFDAVAINLNAAGVGSPFEHPDGEDPGHADRANNRWSRLFEQIVRRTRPADITSVWVDGRRVVDNR